MTVSIADAIKAGSERLRGAGVTDWRRDAGSLMAHLVKRDRTFLIAHAADDLNDTQLQLFRSMIERRAASEPVQYITGHQEFFKLDFEVTPDVLIPRPETELIVEIGLELLRDQRAPVIADIGTGSGCLVISILHELARAQAIAIDISAAALRVAQRNAARHSVCERLQLICSDALSAVAAEGYFDLIVSNPPYVSEAEMNSLQPEVRWEPRSALAAGSDGLTMIRRLLNETRPRLRAGGHFVFEVGFGQSPAVEQAVDRSVWRLIETRADLQEIPRVFVLQGK